MFTHYLNNPDYDLAHSYVIGDRITDMQLAKNLGCKGIWLNNDPNLGAGEMADKIAALHEAGTIALETRDWRSIYEFLRPQRTEALLTAAGCVDCVHALVLGNGIDLVCAMVLSGCPAAVCLKQVVNMPEAEHELVLVPEPARLGTPDVLVRCVRRALKPQGRAVFGIAASPQMTLSITRRLRLNGFRNVRTTAYAGFDVVSAQIPGHRGRA